MGVYAHRFIEVQDKDNKWQALSLWNKYEESDFCQPDLVVGELKLKKNLCFLQRSSSGFYSPGALYSVDDISHPISQSELGDETRNYIEHFDYPVRIESFLLSELEAFSDKCKEQVYAHIADAFHDHNMQLIVKMLASTKEVCLGSDDYEYCGFRLSWWEFSSKRWEFSGVWVGVSYAANSSPIIMPILR